MERKTPDAAVTAHRGEQIGKADATNLVALDENFNQQPGPRLLRDVMTQDFWRSVLPEEVADDLRFARKVERLHKLGPAPLFYMLTECGRQRGLMTFIETLVDRYADLDPDTVKSLGGDQFVQHLAGLDGGKS